MPFDLFGDLLLAEGVDPRWAALTRAFAMSLVTRHPRLRFRLRRIVPPGTHPDLMTVPVDKVDGVLRERVEIPEPKEFWVYMYRCETCNVKGITHGERGLHDGHALIAGKPVTRGISRPWGHGAKGPTDPSNSVWIGAPERISGRGKGFSLAVTSGDFEPEGFRHFATVFWAPWKSKNKKDEIVAKLKGAGVNVVLIDGSLDDQADRFVEHYRENDPDAFDPEDPETAEKDDSRKRMESAAKFFQSKFGKAAR